MGTFIALCIGLVLWLQHRHVQKINKAREKERQNNLQNKESHLIIIARIDPKDDSIW